MREHGYGCAIVARSQTGLHFLSVIALMVGVRASRDSGHNVFRREGLAKGCLRAAVEKVLVVPVAVVRVHEWACRQVWWKSYGIVVAQMGVLAVVWWVVTVVEELPRKMI